MSRKSKTLKDFKEIIMPINETELPCDRCFKWFGKRKLKIIMIGESRLPYWLCNKCEKILKK